MKLRGTEDAAEAQEAQPNPGLCDFYNPAVSHPVQTGLSTLMVFLALFSCNIILKRKSGVKAQLCSSD